MKALTRHSLLLFLSRLSAGIALALFTILLARRLGEANFGEYALIAALIVLGNAFTTFGTDMLLIREIAARRDLSRLPNALVIQLILSVAFIACAFLLPLDSISHAGLRALRVSSLSLIPLAFFTVFTAALRGAEQMGAYAALSLVSAIFQLSAAPFAKDLPSLAWLLLLAQILSALAAAILCARTLNGFGSGWRVSTRETFQLLKDSAPIALLGWLGILYLRLMPLLLIALSGAAVTGGYAAAARVVEAAKLAHISVFGALYPMLSKNSGALKPFLVPLSLLLGATLLLSTSLFFFAQPVIALLFGAGYANASSLLQILAWTLLPYTANAFLTLSLLARGRVSPLASSLTFGLLLLSAATLWWTPLLGARGAALAMLCAETAQFFILLAFFARQTRWSPA